MSQPSIRILLNRKACLVTTACLSIAMVSAADCQFDDVRGYAIESYREMYSLGSNISGAGDVNGDGLGDISLGDPLGANPGSFGKTYHIWGTVEKADKNLQEISCFGASFTGESEWNYLNIGAGSVDFNGDGYSDILLGASGFDQDNLQSSGKAYIVFGEPNLETIDLTDLGPGSVAITGSYSYEYIGNALASIGDANGDGFGDLLLAGLYTERAFVVYGKQDDGKEIPLGSLEISNENGYIVDGNQLFGSFGSSFGGAGDVNGDGFADFIIGAPFSSHAELFEAGEAYVVFGGPDHTNIEAHDLRVSGNARGFTIYGPSARAQAGINVAGIGDTNADGLADVLVALDHEDFYYPGRPNTAFVIFGKGDSDPVYLSDLDGGGYEITFSNRHSAVGVGDINGDGLADIGFSRDNGTARVAFGKDDTSNIQLSEICTNGQGLMFSSQYSGRFTGGYVAGVGDTDSDGLPDLLLGSPLEGPDGRVYVVSNPLEPHPSATYRAYMKTGYAPRLGIGITGDGSNHFHPDSRCFLSFQHGYGANDSASLQAVTLTRNRHSIQNLPEPADVMWEVVTNREKWRTAEVTLKYTDAEIACYVEEEFKIFQAPSPEGPWTELATTIDAGRNHASAIVSEDDGFGFFALAGAPNAPWDSLWMIR